MNFSVVLLLMVTMDATIVARPQYKENAEIAPENLDVLAEPEPTTTTTPATTTTTTTTAAPTTTTTTTTTTPAPTTTTPTTTTAAPGTTTTIGSLTTTTSGPKTTTTSLPTTTTAATTTTTTQSYDWYTAGECGISKKSDAGAGALVVGSTGTEAQAHEYPWIVTLVEVQGPYLVQRCSGTLINRHFAIFSASCVWSFDFANYVYYLRGGEHNLGLWEDEQMQQIAESFIHPQFSSQTRVNNIALLRTITPFTLNDNIQPICEPAAGRSVSQLNGVLAGFDYPNFSIQEEARQGISSQTCSGIYQYYYPVSSTMFCVTDNPTAPSISTCFGDEGTSFAYKSGSGKFEQLGLASYTAYCKYYGLPEVFTLVEPYLDWIQSSMGNYPDV